jgi:hypothetical protein
MTIVWYIFDNSKFWRYLERVKSLKNNKPNLKFNPKTNEYDTKSYSTVRILEISECHILPQLKIIIGMI